MIASPVAIIHPGQAVDALDSGFVSSISFSYSDVQSDMWKPMKHPDTGAANSTRGPLSGIRVLELGTLIAGPFAGRLFADYGADVIKVEHPKGGDPLRDWGRTVGGHGSLWSLVQGRGKRSIALDLHDPEAQQIVLAVGQDGRRHDREFQARSSRGMGARPDRSRRPEPAPRSGPDLRVWSDRSTGPAGGLRDDRGGRWWPPLPDRRSGTATDTRRPQPGRLRGIALRHDRRLGRPPRANDLGARADGRRRADGERVQPPGRRPPGVQLLRDGPRADRQHRPQFCPDECVPLSGFRPCRDRREFVDALRDADANDRASRACDRSRSSKQPGPREACGRTRRGDRGVDIGPVVR